MQYYQFTGFEKEENRLEENSGSRRTREGAKKILAKTKAFNRRFDRKTFVFLSEVADGTMNVGIIAKDVCDYQKITSDFLKAIDRECDESRLDESRLEEITFTELNDLLGTAYRNSYVESDDKILEEFGLDELNNRYYGLKFEEYLLYEKDKKNIYELGDKLIIRDELLPEFERIYAGAKMKGVEGHPVHYVIQTDEASLYRNTAKLLLSALYGNHRINNKRFATIDLEENGEIRFRPLDCLYKSSIGGTIIVEYNGSDLMEDDCADSKRFAIERICSVMERYANRVLTIFCLPRECKALKGIMYENLSNLSLVELREELVSGERAEAYLKKLAAENKIRTDKKLFGKLENEKGYLGYELRSVFDEWYNLKLKTGVYPQYKGIAGVKREIQKAEPKGSAYDELNAMIGLEGAKRVIKQAVDFNKAQEIFAEKGMKSVNISRHMIFTGNPGTAKTSVARLFAKIMRENGVLSKGNLIEVGRSDLVGKFVGWTAQIVKQKFEEAKGSVLFIDEAYSLVDDRSGLFGDEAINTIVQEMENHRDDVVVIFAGYPDKMEEFMSKNPGLRSRISYHVSFDDYDTKSLVEIAKLIAAQKERTFTEDAIRKLEVIFEDARQQNDFGNGRFARNVVEKAMVAQASRLVAMNYEEIERKDVSTICAEDIEMPLTVHKSEMKRIGFCA